MGYTTHRIRSPLLDIHVDFSVQQNILQRIALEQQPVTKTSSQGNIPGMVFS